ncbi:GreA/GreB family elongation factor [Streptomyces sp. Da 82-17]|uniref:GreA/GreB family elongation factor n=1 Tax=Streptomyces sp. Da 82-17 TaxID=3377116 RepID=UPI0038D3F94F
MNGNPEPISAEARRALEEERAGLRAERELVAKTLQTPQEVGDRADEADELQRSNDLKHLDARIDEITVRLQQADLAGAADTEEVGVGSTVTVRFADGATQTMHIGEVAEALDPDMVTADSPLGKALLGSRPGDSVEYRTPGGRAEAVVVSIGESPSGS